MSPIPPKATEERTSIDVGEVPFATKVHRSQVAPYSIISSAVASSVGGTISPSILAV